jgi:hypothetical protein
MQRTCVTLAVVAGLLGSATIGLTQQPTEIGILDCVVDGQTGLVIGAHEGLVCTFVPASGQPNDSYFGAVREVAPDVDMSGPMALRWTVLATMPETYSSGAMEGEYLRVPADATESGADNSVLISGTENIFILRPASVPSAQGRNVAPGITSFQLRSVRA